MTWSTQKAANMRANRAKGIYFTIDSDDANLNVDAFIISTNIPSPYPDYDDDKPFLGDDKDEEAEVVSESTTFPAANTSYSVGVWWSHSYQDDKGGWRYDPDGGTIEFWENLSTPGCPLFCDKYDTHCCNAKVEPFRAYPANPQNAAAVEEEPLDVTQLTTVEAAVSGSAPAGERHYTATRGTIETDVYLHADTSGGLAAYRQAAIQLASSVIQTGPSAGVVTFTRPLSWLELATLTRRGMDVTNVELASTAGADGLRWTFFATYEDGVASLVDAAAEQERAELLGIVSARVVVPNAAVLRDLQDDPAVYLVDLSIADYQLLHPGSVDVSQDDVYWRLAGWE